MAIFAGKVPFHRCHGYAAPGNHMIAGLVAVLAPEVLPPLRHPHVYVMISIRFRQNRTHIAVFDGVAATAAKMAVHAAVGTAGSTHILRDGYQIQIFHR